MKKDKYVVYSIRIPKDIRELMKKVDIDWSSELRRYISQRVRMEYRRKLLESVDKINRDFKKVSIPDAWELIRKDREVDKCC